MPVSRIIFWQPFASPHQEAFLEAMAEQFPGEVILGVEQDLPPERIAQGWRDPVHRRVKVVDISIPANHAALASHRSSDSLHVFTGFFSHPLVWSGFHKLKSSQARLAIYSEAPEQPWQTGWLKRLRGRWLVARYAKRFVFVLAIGGIGCEFFERIGFAKEKIVPFGYYLAVSSLPAAVPARSHDGIFRFISAGQLIHRKGIDLLIKACESLPKTGWQLDIYGDGPKRPALKRLAKRLKLAERIIFHGMVSNVELNKALSLADCAVLPSRFDGWGAIVNESLAVGTAVVCTSRCGSAILLADPAAGGIAAGSCSETLGNCMQRQLIAGPIDDKTRATVQAIAVKSAADTAATRVVAVIAATS